MTLLNWAFMRLLEKEKCKECHNSIHFLQLSLHLKLCTAEEWSFALFISDPKS